MTTESDEQKKRSLRHRVRWWMHRYLAFDVALPDDDETTGTLPRIEEVGTTMRGFAAASEPSPERIAADRVVGTSAIAIPSFAVGDRIADVYDVVQIVNASDLSTAHLSRHRQWNIDLIVKVPNPGLATAPELLREWVAGVKRWAGLGVHPHIASCYALQWVDGVPLAVTEHVGSDSMRALMSQGRCADLRVALSVAIDICNGLHHAHRSGLIHGTLTPGNILLTPQGSPKLSDFELAIALGAPPQRGALALAADAPPAPSASQLELSARQLLLAPAYVAPERWGAAYMAQPAADVFALGVCLYEMFFGRLPYAKTTGAPQALPDAETLRSGDPPPKALLALLQRCVEWTPYRRPGSVEAVREELGALYESLFDRPCGQRSASPEQAASWNAKAVSYHLMGNDSEADEAWAAALAADPTCLEACFNRGIATWRRGLVTDETVLETLGAVAVSDAERWKVAYLLALVHQERGDLESALALLEQAREDRPDSVEIGAAQERIRAACSRAPAQLPVVGEQREYVTAVGMNTDLRSAVSGSYDGTVTLWDLATGNRVRVFEGHSAPVSCAFFNGSGSIVVTGSDDGTLRLWDTESGACRRTLDTRAGRISSAAISPDGGWLLWAGVHSSERVEQMTLQLWETKTGRRVRTFEGLTSAVKSVCFSPDGRWAVTGGDDHSVRIWEVESGTCQQALNGHTHYVSAVSISHDGSRIASGSWDRSVRLWDVASGQQLRALEGHGALVTSVCLSADGQWVLSASWDCSVRLWEAATGRCLRTFRGHSGLVTGVVLSADGRLGISGSWDGTVRVWDTAADRREAAELQTIRNSESRD